MDEEGEEKEKMKSQKKKVQRRGDRRDESC